MGRTKRDRDLNIVTLTSITGAGWPRVTRAFPLWRHNSLVSTSLAIICQPYTSCYSSYRHATWLYAATWYLLTTTYILCSILITNHPYKHICDMIQWLVVRPSIWHITRFYSGQVYIECNVIPVYSNKKRKQDLNFIVVSKIPAKHGKYV